MTRSVSTSKRLARGRSGGLVFLSSPRWTLQGLEVEMSALGDSAAATDNCTEHVGWGSHFRRMHTEEVHGMEAEAPVPFRPVMLSQPGSRSAPVLTGFDCVKGTHVLRVGP